MVREFRGSSREEQRIRDVTDKVRRVIAANHIPPNGTIKVPVVFNRHEVTKGIPAKVEKRLCGFHDISAARFANNEFEVTLG